MAVFHNFLPDFSKTDAGGWSCVCFFACLACKNAGKRADYASAPARLLCHLVRPEIVPAKIRRYSVRTVQILQETPAIYADPKMQDALQDCFPAMHVLFFVLCILYNCAFLLLCKIVDSLQKACIITLVKNESSLRKCSLYFKMEERMMLSVLAVCGVAYLVGMVAMTVHGMKA